MTTKPRLWGSTAALAIGIVAILSGLVNPQNPGSLIAGVVAVIGSLMYRSAKRTRLGLVRPSAIRHLTETLGVVVVVTIIGLQRDALALMYADPVPNLIIPIWALAAYCVAKVSAVIVANRAVMRPAASLDGSTKGEPPK